MVRHEDQSRTVGRRRIEVHTNITQRIDAELYAADEPGVWRDPNQTEVISIPGYCAGINGVEEDSVNHSVRLPVRKKSTTWGRALVTKHAYLCHLPEDRRRLRYIVNVSATRMSTSAAEPRPPLTVT